MLYDVPLSFAHRVDRCPVHRPRTRWFWSRSCVWLARGLGLLERRSRDFLSPGARGLQNEVAVLLDVELLRQVGIVFAH